MHFLVVNTICCLIAVMWVALALARRIRLARAFEARTITPLVAKLAQQRLSRLVNLDSSVRFASNRRFCSISPADLYWRSSVDLYHGAVEFLEAPEGVEHWATTSAARRSELIAIRAAAAYPALFGQSLPIANIVPRHSRDGHKFVKPAAGLQTRTLHRDAIQSNSHFIVDVAARALTGFSGR